MKKPTYRKSDIVRIIKESGYEIEVFETTTGFDRVIFANTKDNCSCMSFNTEDGNNYTLNYQYSGPFIEYGKIKYGGAFKVDESCDLTSIKNRLLELRLKEKQLMKEIRKKMIREL